MTGHKLGGALLATVVITASAALATSSQQTEPTKPAAPRGTGSAQTAAPRNLPKDVYPESGNRLPLITEKDLDEFGQKLLKEFETERGGGPAESGPRSIRLYSPHVAEYMTKGNQYLRYQAGIDPKLRELAILMAARATDQQYEWAAHEATAIKVGLPQHVIDIVKLGKPITGVTDPKQAIIIALGREALYDHKVRSDTFAKALDLFGKKGLVDIVALMAHYTATAITLTVFDQQLRGGQQPALAPLQGKPWQQ
jgi:4-carboxymuconolactone decarboxylase